MWIVMAILSAVFAGLTAILAKCGIHKTNSDVATALRTIVVLAFSVLMVFIVGSQGSITNISSKSWVFLILSGAATGASWLCYYYAIQKGMVSVVVPIDKMSILLTILFSRVFLKEKLSGRALIGLCLMCAGTLLMVFQA